MEPISLGTKIILIIIILHLIAGFGFLIYKLSPRKEDNEENNEGN